MNISSFKKSSTELQSFSAPSFKSHMTTLFLLDLGPVVRRPISANPGLNFNLRFFIPLLKSLFGKIFSVLFKASNSHTLDKKNSIELSFKAFRSEIGFHTNPGLS